MDAWKALACVLAAHGYKIRPEDTSSYNCRAITGGSGPSLHSYGIALDVNANTNPYRKTPNQPKVRFSDKGTQSERARDVAAMLADTDMTPDMIADVEAVKTANGVRVFEWGGSWTTVKDSMHFEIDVTPAELAAGIDWNSVKGANGVAPSSIAWKQDAPQPSPVIASFAGELGVFEKCMPVIEKWEGHFDNDPDDPGGPTNMGITQADLARSRQHPVSVDDVRNLSRDEARQIFKALYWNRIKGDQLPLPAAQMCLDSAVLTGVARAGRDLQESLNRQDANIAVDGVIGPNTISASLRADTKRLVSDFGDIAEAYLRGRPGFPKYGKGWLNRLNDVRAIAAAMANAPQQKQPAEGGAKMPTPVNNIVSVLQQVLPLLQAIQKQQTTTTDQTTTPPQIQAVDLKKIVDIITAIAGKDPSQALGQVNGALGETMGNMLNGKKTAIGTIGALLTAVLPQVIPADAGLAKAVALLAPAAGLSGVALPIFLAMAAWGVLGKLEKWSGNSGPPAAPK